MNEFSMHRYSVTNTLAFPSQSNDGTFGEQYIQFWFCCYTELLMKVRIIIKNQVIS